MKLALAQYRELESFAQFDSDLDPETKRALARGKAATELLKQDQYAPVSVSLQVASLYAVNNGFLDTIPVAGIREWETGLHTFMTSAKGTLLQAIATDWNETIETELKQALEEYALTRQGN